jgi:hypothetical protein
LAMLEGWTLVIAQLQELNGRRANQGALGCHKIRNQGRRSAATA